MKLKKLRMEDKLVLENSMNLTSIFSKFLRKRHYILEYEDPKINFSLLNFKHENKAIFIMLTL